MEISEILTLHLRPGTDRAGRISEIRSPWTYNTPALPARFGQLKVQMRLHRRPFAGDDAVDAGVAQRAVGRQLVMAQDTVELGTQALDAAPALVIDEMGAEFDRDA